MSRYLFDARAHRAHFPGIGRTIEGLLPALVAACGADEEIVAIAPLGGEWPCETVRADSSPLAGRQHLEVPRLIRRVGPRVFHTPYLTVPLRPGAPTVVTVNDVIPRQIPDALTRTRRAAYGLTLRQALWTADRVVAPSQATADAVGALWPHRPIEVVAHGVDHERFGPRAPAAVDRARARHGLERSYVLAVTSGRRHKNRPALLGEWQQLAPPDTELVLVGPPPDATPEGVRALGRVDDQDLAALFAGADVAITASLQEGFGLPVLEAMACGAPVACSAIPVLEEVAGDAAAYFDPRRPGDLAATLRRLLDDPAGRRRMAAAGQARAARFTWAQAASRTLETYRRAA